ncbi:MAG: hypothetical protein C4319_03545 [Acidimicrobiia bacterium]
MSDGGSFGRWVTDTAGLPAFEIVPAMIGSLGWEESGLGDGHSTEANPAGLSTLVLPEGGVGRLWHLVGAASLVATSHLSGDITLYFTPRTLMKLTGEPGSQRRTLSIGARVVPLDQPERVVFGCGYCEWRYRVPVLESQTGQSQKAPYQPEVSLPLREEVSISIRRRLTLESEGCLSLTIIVEGAPRNCLYKEEWTLAPEALVPIPLMGCGPVPVADANFSHIVSRYVAYAVSGVIRGIGSVVRSASRFAYRLRVQPVGRSAVVLSSDSFGLPFGDELPLYRGLPLVRRLPLVTRLPPARPRDVMVALEGGRPEEPAPVDASFPKIAFRLMQGPQGDSVSAEASCPDSRPIGTVASYKPSSDGASGAVFGSAERAKAEITIQFEPNEENTLSLAISVTDDEALLPPQSQAPSQAIAPCFHAIRPGVPERIPPVRDRPLARELLWHLSYLRQLAVADAYFKRRFVTQGSAYTFLQGAHGAPRDYAIAAAALSEADPDLAKSTLEVMMMMTTPSGSMFYMHAGRGWCSDAVVHPHPSDLPIFLIWAVCEYVEGSGDEGFLDVSVPFYPLHKRAEATVAERIALAYRWLVNTLGRGPHGMLRVGSGDWADPISMMVDNAKAFHRKGESGLNTAFAAYALSRASHLLRKRDPALATEMESFAKELSEAMERSWTGSWYLRGWDGNDKPLGNSHLFLDVQAFCLIAGVGSDANIRTLIEEIKVNCIDPSPIGAVILDRPHPVRLGLIPAGWDCNGGVWAAINAFLAWGLARYDRDLAIECLRKQTLASHARSYPNIWYGIWSGPDSYNAHYAERPGETFNLPATPMSQYPVMNSNAHAGPLLAARKIFGETQGEL